MLFVSTLLSQQCVVGVRCITADSERCCEWGERCYNPFFECRNRLTPFGRTPETEFGLHGASLSFGSIIGSIVLFCAISFAVLTFTSRRLTPAPALSSAFNHVKLTIKYSHVYGCDVKSIRSCLRSVLWNVIKSNFSYIVVSLDSMGSTIFTSAPRASSSSMFFNVPCCAENIRAPLPCMRAP